MEEGKYIFSCSDKKQEEERDSLVNVQTRGKEELRESKFMRRDLLILNVSSVIGLFCISTGSVQFQHYFVVLYFQLCKMHCRLTFSFHEFLLHTMKFKITVGFCAVSGILLNNGRI